MAPTTPPPGSRLRDAIPRSLGGWWRFGRAVWAETSADQVLLLAGGIAFFTFISLFPTVIATGMVYGLVSDPDQVADQVEVIGSVLPQAADELLATQLTRLADASDRSLGLGLIVALAVALWGASTATSNLISAVNAAYDHTLRRSFVHRRAMAIAMTLGAIAFMALAVGLIAVGPLVVDALDVPRWVVSAFGVGRWIGLIVAVNAALAILYRFAPFRRQTRIRWVSLGVIVATFVWIIAAAGFSIYVDRLAAYGSTYGSLAGVIVLLFWLWLGAFAVLLGAEVNAELERRRRSAAP